MTDHTAPRTLREILATNPDISARFPGTAPPGAALAPIRNWYPARRQALLAALAVAEIEFTPKGTLRGRPDSSVVFLRIQAQAMAPEMGALFHFRSAAGSKILPLKVPLDSGLPTLPESFGPAPWCVEVPCPDGGGDVRGGTVGWASEFCALAWAMALERAEEEASKRVGA